MAEVIGIVASAVSISQLTGQIAEGIIKLKGFWDQVKDAPEDISYLIRELEVLKNVLYELEPKQLRNHHDEIIGGYAFQQSLALCREGTHELVCLADTLSSEISSSRRFKKARGCVKMVIKKEKIKRYKSRLKSAVNLLSLSHQCYTRYKYSPLCLQHTYCIYSLKD